MKAVEYVKMWNGFLTTPPPDDIWKDKPEGATTHPAISATCAVCLKLVQEMQPLIAARRAKSPSAVAAVVTEINQKWVSISRKLNSIYASEDAFMSVLLNVLPDVHDAYQAFRKSQGVKMPGRT